MSLDDIWEADLIEAPIVHAPATYTDASRSERRQLFYSDSENDGVQDLRANDTPNNRESSPRPAPPTKAISKDQLDAMFAGLEDEEDIFGDVGGAIDVEKMKRQSAAKIAATKGPVKNKTTSTFDPLAAGLSPPKKGKDEAKPKRILPKLDEERLLGKDGFPRLIKEYKSFKITGKGHEASDLDRLFHLYHGWAHKLYPKYKFADTVGQVEKLCRSRRMAANLRVWREEVDGIKPNDVTKNSDDDDDDDDGDGERRNDHADASSMGSLITDTRPASVASIAPSVPSSATEADDMDIDALIREEEELLRETDGEQNRNTYKLAAAQEDDEAALSAEIPDLPTEQAPVPPNHGHKPPHNEMDDDDIWDIATEMDAPSNKIDSVDDVRGRDMEVMQNQPVIGADWDDMYA